jgi:transcriptional regulator with XRE-family HTH domain
VHVTTRRDGLRLRRQELGFTQEQLAGQLGVSTTTYRNWELGTTFARIGFRPRLADRLGVTVEEVGLWFSEDNGRVLAPKGMAVPAWLGHLATLEQGASRILTYEPIVVPGLLQTEDYATAVERTGGISEQDVAKFVQARIARQDVLFRAEAPLELSAVIDEAVLHRRAGSKAIMAAQLQHLLDILVRCPTVEVRVLPLDAEAFQAAWGSFVILTSPGSTEPYMACAVDGVGAHYLDRPGETEAHTAIFTRLSAVALSPAESRSLIAVTLQERYR